MMYWLPLALVALVLLSVATSQWGAAGAGFVLLANWIVNTALFPFFGERAAWMLFTVTDFTSAGVVMGYGAHFITGGNPPSRWHAVIALIFGVQMIAHCSFGLSSKGPSAVRLDYWLLFYLAWAQALTVGGCLGQGLLRRLVHRRGGIGRLLDLPASMAAAGRQNRPEA